MAFSPYGHASYGELSLYKTCFTYALVKNMLFSTNSEKNHAILKRYSWIYNFSLNLDDKEKFTDFFLIDIKTSRPLHFEA